MKYNKNRKYRDQEKTIESEIKVVRKKIKKKKEGFFSKIINSIKRIFKG